MAPWLESPAGRYLLAWEQRQLDHVGADIFGYHAVQLGWPMVQALRASRISHRWLLNDGTLEAGPDLALGLSYALWPAYWLGQALILLAFLRAAVDLGPRRA